MSDHDPANNLNNWIHPNKPAADEVEQIPDMRDRLTWRIDQTRKAKGVSLEGFQAFCELYNEDCATLLRIVDQLRAELAAAQSELAVVDSAPKYEDGSTYSAGWNDCLAWISQNRKALQEPTK